MEIYQLSASEIIKKIANKDLTARQVAEAFITRIKEVNPQLNAVHQVDTVRILHAADEADQAILMGKPLGKLHGLPITIKDTCEISGFIVGKGYPYFLKSAIKDSTIVSRLRSEGAIILGVTNVPELLFAYETDNRTHGRTNNPYDLARTPGGSSGGEAALLAVGGSPLGIGSDAGGSIRQPAHYCGICAHKPTHGLLPFTGDIPFDGAAGLVASLLTMGPMGRYIEDLMLMMEVISGGDVLDPYVPPVNFKRSALPLDLSALKIAYYIENPFAPPTTETEGAVMKAVQALTAEGAELYRDFPKLLEETYRLHWETFFLGGDKGAGLKELFKKFKDVELTPLLKKIIIEAEKCSFTLTELRQRLVEVEQFRYEMLNWMEVNGYDVVISPVASTPARYHGETFEHIHDFEYVRAHNLTRWPATIVPISYATNGLPIAVQIAAKPWHDHLSLAVAQVLQNKFGVFPCPEIKPDTLTISPTLTGQL
ncbi:MAG: aspartyl/glutamyl-tRNA(Asn/Gln) amidotransferase subunit [Gammaproteobacteria bacterium]|jgi:amidase|nr:aspartyl/glutamyl-tRNA(Asn/Gln) amidotransferase subunit [Gammaproteobacteria bacterium]